METGFEISSQSIRLTFEELSGKWTLMILAELRQAPCQFNELKRRLGISTKTLSNDLARLEARGLIDREVKSTRPVTVEYSLTDKGFDLDQIFIEVMKWQQKWLEKK